jgi:superfamily II DNA or RNA helicase
MMTSAWLEVVNDRLSVFVSIRNTRKSEIFDDNLAIRYKAEIEKQFYEIINGCELERREIPLHQRLKDDIVPVYDASSLRHQVEALRFCCSMKVSALYADTGTGKSKIAIDLVVSRYEAGQIKKVLVFLPMATKKNFQNQITQWCHYPQIEWRMIGHESMGSSEKIVFEALNYVDSETQIIVDESHLIKTPTAKRSQRIKLVCEKTSYKLVMTGTPVTDNVHDLYMQYAVLSPLIIGVRNWKKFEEKYLVMGGRMRDEIVGYKNIDYLMGLLEPYTYQITKEDCLNLPAKQYHTHTCELTDRQWDYYIEEKDRLLRIILSDNFTAANIFQTFTRMQQICSGYSVLNGDKIPLKSNKLSLFDQIPSNEKTVIFCKYLFEVTALTEHFKRENCALFTGQNPKERDRELRDFVSGNKQYFIATMHSGGTGLNGLQEVCRQVVFFSNSFSYFHRKQSVGRIDRQGQQNEMFIHDFCTNANIDDKIMQNLKRKSNLSDEIKKLMNDKTKLKKYIESLYKNEKYTYICKKNTNSMRMEILAGTEKRLYEVVGPLVMNPAVLRQNDGVAFKTSENHVYFVALDDADDCVGFIPVQKKGKMGLINNYYIQDRDKELMSSLIKSAEKYLKSEKLKFLAIIAQSTDYEVVQKLKFTVEKPFVKNTRFIKKI